MDDILLAKATIIERYLHRIDTEYQDDPERLENFTHQDAIVLNLQRSCQAAIDMAMHIVARDHLGVPAASAEAFDLLANAECIDAGLAKRMRGMVGFRNIAVHEYQKLDLAILQAVIEHGGDDFIAFCAAVGLKIL